MVLGGPGGGGETGGNGGGGYNLSGFTGVDHVNLSGSSVTGGNGGEGIRSVGGQGGAAILIGAGGGPVDNITTSFTGNVTGGNGGAGQGNSKRHEAGDSYNISGNGIDHVMIGGVNVYGGQGGASSIIGGQGGNAFLIASGSGITNFTSNLTGDAIGGAGSRNVSGGPFGSRRRRL